jgi:hypothetical protein
MITTICLTLALAAARSAEVGSAVAVLAVILVGAGAEVAGGVVVLTAGVVAVGAVGLVGAGVQIALEPAFLAVALSFLAPATGTFGTDAAQLDNNAAIKTRFTSCTLESIFIWIDILVGGSPFLWRANATGGLYPRSPLQL